MYIGNCVVYDVEVAIDPSEVEGGWDNPEGMGFASAVTYSYEDDQYRFWLGPGDLKVLLLFLFGKTCVTFNGIHFDSRVLLGNGRIVEAGGLTTLTLGVERGDPGWDNYDLLLEYIKTRFGDPDVATAEKRLGDKAIHDGTFTLDGLAQGTLGLRKSGHGAHAPILYQRKEYAKLMAYNLHDVRLTKKLFDFARQHGYVVDRDGRAVKINLN